MKKNIKTNVGGLLFNLDEDAYQNLEIYLNRLENHFSKTEGKKEIIEDIERGIADMLTSKLTNGKTIINLEDIKEIIKAMGEPGEIDNETEESPKTSFNNSSAQRRLYRDSDEKVIAGVCSGISHYLNIDVAWIRILFVILFFLSGTGLLIYLVLWIAVPEAKSTAQKLEMSGESITIDNIEKKIREEFESIGNQLNNFKDKHLSKKKDSLTKTVKNTSSLIGTIILAILKIFFITIGVIFTILALVMLGFLIPAFFTGDGSIFSVYNDFVYFSIPNGLSATISNISDYRLILYSIIAVLLIPLLTILISALGYLFKLRNETRGINKALGILWIVGLILLIFMAFKTRNQFEHSESISEEIIYQFPKNQDTLYIQLNPNLVNINNMDEDIAKIYDSFDEKFIFFGSNESYFGTPQFEKHNTEDTIIKIKIVKYSNGDKKKKAISNAESINYIVNQKDSLVEFSPLFSFPKSDFWRNQKIKIKIFVPNGKNVKLNRNPKIEDELIREIEKEWEYITN
jgi:phage shock protein PspC (stress-responsive transcriptional regulator)